MNTLLALVLIFAQDDEAPSATIDAVWIENGKQEYEYGIFLKVDFQINGSFDKPCTLVSWIYDTERKPLKDRNGEYRDVNGNVSSMNDFKPGFPRTKFTKYPIFIPYNEFHVGPGDHNFLFKIGVFLKENGKYTQVAISDFYKLNFSWKIPQSGEITKLDVDYNSKKDNVNGIKFTANYSTHGMKDGEGRWVVEFYYELSSLSYLYKNGREGDGMMSFVQAFTPKFEHADYTGGTYWVPYSLFPLKIGRNVFYYKVWLQAKGSDGKWYTVDATSAQEFYVNNGELKLKEAWVIDQKEVQVDWEMSEKEAAILEETLREFNRRLWDATDGQIRIKKFMITGMTEHPVDHMDGVMRVYKDFKGGDHGKLTDAARGFVTQVRPFAFLSTPDRPGDMHLAFEKMVAQGASLYSRALVHEFCHATFGLNDEYGEIMGDDGKPFFGSYCARTENLRRAWNACIMGTYQPLHRELCKPDTHTVDEANPKLHKLDCYTRVKLSLKKAYDIDIVIPETAVEGPHDPPNPRFEWD